MNISRSWRLNSAAKKQRGLALISIMVMVTLITILLAGIFYRHQLDIVRATRILAGEQAVLMALSAESWALTIFDEDDDNFDHLQEDWARQIPLLPMDGGSVTGSIVDLQARFNINNFADYDVKRWRTESVHLDAATMLAMYVRLLGYLEVEWDLSSVASIVDWIDKDTSPISADGAEDDVYYQQGLSYVAANAMLLEASELALVNSYELNDVIKLNEYITALPAAKITINVNTASKEIMMALHEDIDEQVAESLIEARPYEQLPQFESELQALTNTQGNIVGGLVDVKSSYFLLTADIVLGDVNLRLDSYLYRSNGKVAVMYRNVRFVPKLEQLAKDLDDENSIFDETTVGLN